MRTNIFLDMDGCLSSFTTGVLDAMNHCYEKEITVEWYAENHPYWEVYDAYRKGVYDMWKAIEEFPTFWYDLPAFPWAEQLYRELSKMGEVTILTAPPPVSHFSASEQKLAWLKRHLNVDPRNVILGCKKYLLAGNGILIDDYSVNCKKFEDCGGSAICIPSDWNTPGLNYEMVINEIKEKMHA